MVFYFTVSLYFSLHSFRKDVVEADVQRTVTVVVGYQLEEVKRTPRADENWGWSGVGSINKTRENH